MTELAEPRTVTPMSPNTVVANTSPSLKRKADDDGNDARKSASPTKKASKLSPEEQEAARLKKIEQEERKAARLEKKMELEREKEKKEALLKKQKNAMASFFKKPAAPSSTTGRASPAGPSTHPARQPSPEKESDYIRTFKKPAKRANTRWAPVNRWSNPQEANESGTEQSKVDNWTAPAFLREHLSRHHHKPSAKRKIQPGFKTAPPHGSVAEVWDKYQDAEDPRAVLSKLRNKERFPWKTLAFDQQTRPPYRGTWTKRSVAVGPRTPFAQDPVFDYSYDSGDDWHDDEGGEDVDNFGEANAEVEEEENDEDESEGEFDDWLDDTEDAGLRAGTPASVDGDGPPGVGAGQEQSRLPMKVVKKSAQPKRVVPLKPRADGPLWESEIGKGNEGFEGYRLQLLNETPDSIDPFSYTSLDPAPCFKTTFSMVVIGSNLSVKCLLSAQPTVAPKPPAAIPPLRPSETADGSAPAASTADTDATKSKPAGPKSTFPQSHLEELLRLIDGNTKIRTDLISQLRAHFETVTTKGAIEAKVKEVAIRNGKAKDSKWEVKPEAWAAAGVAMGTGPVAPAITPAPVVMSSSSF